MSRMLMFVLAAALSMAAGSQQAPPSQSDADFIMKAAEAGMKEVEAAKLAAEKASNPDVKAYARRLVVDHFLVNDELLKLSRSRNVALKVALKTDPTELLKTGQPNATAAEGVAYDRAFIDQMVKDHQQAVDLFKAEADDGKDREVREWAEKKLLTLKDHLKFAKDLQDKISR